VTTTTEAPPVHQLRIDSADWRAAVGWACTGTPARPTVPILACLRLQYLAGNLEISGFDYEQSALAVIPAAGEFHDDPFLISGTLLAAVTKQMPKEPVTLTAAGSDMITVACGPVTYHLPVISNVADYPLLPALPDPAGTVDGPRLTAALRAVVAATSKDDTLPALAAVETRFGETELMFAATDRYRMCVVTVPWNRDPEVTADPAPVLLPGVACQAIIRSSADGPVTLHNSGDNLVGYATSDGTTLTTRLTDAQFPAATTRIDAGEKDAAGTVELRPGPVIEALDRVSPVLDKNEPIHLVFTPGYLTVSSQPGDFGAAEETMAVDTDRLLGADGDLLGGEVDIPISYQYFRDGLTAMACAESVALKYSKPAKPVLLSGSHDGLTFQYLVVPLRDAR
jgi:DNA polymerase-3 subunit beta